MKRGLIIEMGKIKSDKENILKQTFSILKDKLRLNTNEIRKSRDEDFR